MIKCFLSHSSIDKERYVHIVANAIKKEATIYDEVTFEKGMGPKEEIARFLEQTSLFVIFLSNTSLESQWVQSELLEARKLLDESKIQRIYPIIIDDKIDYKDPRIPEWMRDEFNIKYISSPKTAARRINARLMELSWDSHPKLKERKSIFVGRNDLIKQIEERLNDFSASTPAAVIACGLSTIGRKSLLSNAAYKANLVKDSYEFPVISLSEHDGIEDFILKVDDLGFSNDPTIRDSVGKGMAEKTIAVRSLVRSMLNERERLMIEDHGAIVLRDGELVDWFKEALSIAAEDDLIGFFIASRYKAKMNLNHKIPSVYILNVGELEKNERNGLLARYAKFRNLDLLKDDLSFFSDLLTGYPEQVLFTVDLIAEDGLINARKNTHLIQQYASDKASIVLTTVADDDDKLDFIKLLSRFEFISADVLFNIVPEEKYSPILESLLAHSVCERIGTTGEYFRLNDAIRDYIGRSRFGLPDKFNDAIRRHVEGFIDQINADQRDVSDYLFSLRENLLSGNNVSDALIIPSVFIKVIKKLYDEDRNYNMALELAKRALLNKDRLHPNSVGYIRFTKCQCLARKRSSSEFFSEVQHVPDPDKSFLLGFYYRLAGNTSTAEEHLKRAFEMRPGDLRTAGELVQVYLQNDEPNLAFSLARQNYVNAPHNPINANNYFYCLLHRDKTPATKSELTEGLDRLALNPSERAREIVRTNRAKLLAYFDGDEGGAFALVEEAIAMVTDRIYPLLTKAELAIHFRDRQKLAEATNALESAVSKHAQTYRTFARFKAMRLAMDGQLTVAKRLVAAELRGLKPSALRRLDEKLEQLADPSNPIKK